MKALIRVLVSFFVFIVDVVYGNRSYARFYVLETIARTFPISQYYISMKRWVSGADLTC